MGEELICYSVAGGKTCFVGGTFVCLFCHSQALVNLSVSPQFLHCEIYDANHSGVVESMERAIYLQQKYVLWCHNTAVNLDLMDKLVN